MAKRIYEIIISKDLNRYLNKTLFHVLFIFCEIKNGNSFLYFQLSQQQSNHWQRNKNHWKKKITKGNLNKIIKDHQIHFQRS